MKVNKIISIESIAVHNENDLQQNMNHVEQHQGLHCLELNH